MVMNKGLEVIEARWLFGLDYDDIRVVIHPQSIIHSLVEFRDSSVLAQMGPPDMRLPIQYALTYPLRVEANYLRRLDLVDVGTLTFEEPDLERFPCLRLCREAGEAGGTAPVVLNAANEEAVAALLAGNLRYIDLPRVVERALTQLPARPVPDLETALDADAAARQYMRGIL
mgnify:CR=1 FL=1